ncbi:hypothetical protein GSI_10343 [Ganoderma sinense ZZ0214-1]|uniref:Uncharacterized protein n=1 Tax=Ganoderma sinense ZZ0214-1 TaxID=1077348 RepID=A0A2G8S0A4_9APHY|nr:hypothetical protein GSI_10343 [Ganoderma sinense ZZ0214-1]
MMPMPDARPTEEEARIASGSAGSVTMATAIERRPSKSGPKRIRKRTAEYQAKRDARRREAWARKKEEDTYTAQIPLVGDDSNPSPSRNVGASNASGQVQVQAQAQTQAQGGRSVEGTTSTDTRTGRGFLESKMQNPKLRVVPHNGGSAAYVADAEQRLVLYRGYTGRGTEAANAAALAAAGYLSSTVGSKTCYFVLYDAGVAYPSLHTYLFGNIEVGLHAVGLLQPLLSLVNGKSAYQHWGLELRVLNLSRGIFWHRLPDPHTRCPKPLQYILGEDGTLKASPAFPFAAFAITMGDTIPEPPIDSLAVGPGLKCIVPFGPVDGRKGIRLRLGMPEASSSLVEVEVEVEVQSGQPIFVPSATFASCSGPLVSDSMLHGSVVLWTNGPLS